MRKKAEILRLLFHRAQFSMKQQKNPGNLTVPGYLLRLDTMRFLEATFFIYIYGASSCLLRIQEARFTTIWTVFLHEAQKKVNFFLLFT